MAREIWPYRRIEEADIQFEPWLLDGVEGAALPTYLEGWDPLTDIDIQRTIRCNVPSIRSTTGLASAAPLSLTVSWANKQSFMTEAVYRAPLDAEHTIRVSLPASRLGGSIVLRTTITVGSTDSLRPLGTPRWAGSVLASHEQLLVLEASGPMFPISAIDFASTKYSPDASWALQLPEDLTLPVLGSILLLVNSRDTELTRALGAANPDPRQTALLEEIEARIGVYLIAQAVSRRTELEIEEWDDQSAGHLLADYLSIAEERRVLPAVLGGDPAALTSAMDGAARAEGFGRRFL